MATVQHPSGFPSWDVEDPGPFVAAGWTKTAGSSLSGLTVGDLRRLAADQDIDLAGAKKKADILSVLGAAGL